jgi:hypothetical protein
MREIVRGNGNQNQGEMMINRIYWNETAQVEEIGKWMRCQIEPSLSKDGWGKNEIYVSSICSFKMIQIFHFWNPDLHTHFKERWKCQKGFVIILTQSGKKGLNGLESKCKKDKSGCKKNRKWK